MGAHLGSPCDNESNESSIGVYVLAAVSGNPHVELHFVVSVVIKVPKDKLETHFRLSGKSPGAAIIC